MGGAAWPWVLAGLTTGMILKYELSLLRQRLRSQSGRGILGHHASLREDWYAAVSAQPGTEVLAVQTLRNSVMSATVRASTAALALISTVSLLAPSKVAASGITTLGARELLDLLLMGLLCASLACSLFAVRLYNHAGFVCGMPVGCGARTAWSPAAVRYIRDAGLLYGVGLRQMVLVVPVVVSLYHPLVGIFTAAAVTGGLFWLDRTQGNG